MYVLMVAKEASSNLPLQMYRLTVRTSKDTVSQHMAAVLAEQF